MKLVKLLLIFVLIAGGIFLALNLNSLFSSDGEKWAENDQVDIARKCASIRNRIASMEEWDHPFYLSIREDLEQDKSMGLYTLEGYNTVNNTLRESSINKAVSLYTDMINCKKAFSHKALVANYDGLESLAKAEKASGDRRIETVRAIHSLYRKVNSFVSGPKRIRPAFDGERASWSSFDAIRNGMLSTAASYRNNPLFMQMADVPGFADGLNDAILRTTLEPQRRPFYLTLSSQILSHFRPLESNDENYKHFLTAYNRFATESQEGFDDLATFKINFKPQKSE